jgi:hypothetical protein
VRSEVDSAELAMLIVSTLEGSFMIRRLQKKDGPVDLACQHLEEYLETKVRARQSRTGAGRSRELKESPRSPNPESGPKRIMHKRRA